MLKVDVEGVGFRPRAVVAGIGVVAVCTRKWSFEPKIGSVDGTYP